MNQSDIPDANDPYLPQIDEKFGEHSQIEEDDEERGQKRHRG